jgi:hypothetical protein
MTTLAGDIGVFKNTANSGGVTTGVAANTGSGTIFARRSRSRRRDRKDVTNTGTTYPTDKREQPLWQAIGLSADPGGLRHRRQGHDREHRRRRPRGPRSPVRRQRHLIPFVVVLPWAAGHTAAHFF